MRRATALAVGLLLAAGVGAWQLGVSLAGEADEVVCAKCAPVTTRAVSEARGFFIAHDEVQAQKSARAFAYRVATERVVRSVEQARLRCPKGGCVAGSVEITTGLEERYPCRKGRLVKRKKKSRQRWRQACLNTLDYAKQCDSAEVQTEKPFWAKCRVTIWAKKTLTCAPPHCRSGSGR